MIRSQAYNRTHPRAGGEFDPLGLGLGLAQDSPPRRRGVRGRVRALPEGHVTHPRAGGEFHRPVGPCLQHVDSPPRRRGVRGGRAVLRGAVRLTPAQAGSSWTTPSPTSRRRTHPRAGGEFQASQEGSVRSSDSPPRRRGVLAILLALTVPDGLTPAQAGSSCDRIVARWCARTHPRAGGEFSAPVAGMFRGMDSPPRRRGVRCSVPLHRGVSGLTPAQAGSSGAAATGAVSSRTHPRAGGEFANDIVTLSARKDSPPRRRGVQPPGGWTEADRGLTPAQAGSSPSRRPGPAASRTHPRAGGEFYATGGGPLDGGDSPPRRRGVRVFGEVGFDGDGLTPAQAGSSKPRSSSKKKDWTHPRAGGEFAVPVLVEAGWGDSPPRRRGVLLSRRGTVVAQGLTPAQAGSSSQPVREGTPRRTHPRAGGEFPFSAAKTWRVIES